MFNTVILLLLARLSRHSNLPYFKKIYLLTIIPNIIFNIPLYFTGITTYIYTELAPKLTATASVAQSVERWSRDPGSWARFPAGGLGVAFFATGPKCISFRNCILTLFTSNCMFVYFEWSPPVILKNREL